MFRILTWGYLRRYHDICQRGQPGDGFRPVAGRQCRDNPIAPELSGDVISEANPVPPPPSHITVACRQ